MQKHQSDAKRLFAAHRIMATGAAVPAACIIGTARRMSAGVDWPSTAIPASGREAWEGNTWSLSLPPSPSEQRCITN